MHPRSSGPSDANAVTWLLPALLRRRGVSAPEFAAMLRAGGYRISDSQVYRLLQHKPERYEGAQLTAICRTLGCDLFDLLHYDPHASVVSPLPPPFRLPGS